MKNTNESRIVEIGKYIDAGKAAVAKAKSLDTNGTLWKVTVGTESVSTGYNSLNTGLTNAVDNILQEAQINDMRTSKMSYAAQRASQIILAAAGTEGGLTNMAKRVATESTSAPYKSFISAANPGSALSSIDYGRDPMWANEKVGAEYFSNTDYDKRLGLTWALNVRALDTQSRFAECLYPTITVDPTDVGVIVKTKITQVSRGVLNALMKNDCVPDQRRGLHEALSDYRVLEDDAIRIIPYATEDGSNAKYFVDKTLFPTQQVTISRVPAYPTNFLAFTAGKFNLFQLSAHPGIVSLGYNETDEVATGASLGEVLLAIRAKGEALADSKFIRIKTRDMQFATFQKPVEGTGRELTLQFRNTLFSLGASTTDVNGAPIPALAALTSNNYTLKYSLGIYGSLETGGENSGRLQMNPPTSVSEYVLDADGTKMPLEGSVATIVENIVVEPYGFTVSATRTNENKRTQGLMLDPAWETESYMLQYGSPLIAKSPIGLDMNEAERLDDLITAVNIRNESLAVSQTLNYTETLEEVLKTRVSMFEKLPIRGLGRNWVDGWVETIDYDVFAQTQSLDNKDMLENARQGLLNRINDQVSRAIQESRYSSAMRLLVSDPNALPTVILAMDEPTANQLLLKSGDVRTLNDRYNMEIITTADMRWRTKDDKYEDEPIRRIQWFLRVSDGQDGSYNVLNWGNHFWSPITVTNVPMTRDGGIHNELAVQPRNIHVNHCPITGVIMLRGLNMFIKSLLRFNTTVTP